MITFHDVKWVLIKSIVCLGAVPVLVSAGMMEESPDSDDSKFIGKWTSTEHIENDNGVITRTGISYTLCADHYAWCDFTIKVSFNGQDVSANFAGRVECPGVWRVGGGNDVEIELNDELCAWETTKEDVVWKSYYHSDIGDHLRDKLTYSMKDCCSSYYNVLRISDKKRLGMKFSKLKSDGSPDLYFIPSQVKTDEGMAEFTVIDRTDVPMTGLVRGALRVNGSDNTQLGLFIRNQNLTPYYTVNHSSDGTFTSGASGDLSYEAREREGRLCAEYADSALCPVSGEAGYKYSDGRSYSGGWEGGKISGQGRMDFPNGSYLEGTWAVGVLATGTAKMVLPGNYEYVGGIKDDLADGEGTLTVAGSVYSGWWSQGTLCEGKVVRAMGKGSVFNGNVKDGLIEGHCNISVRDGSYEGYWSKGDFTGEVTVCKKDQYEYVGTFSPSGFQEGVCRFLATGDSLSGKWQMIVGQESLREGVLILSQTGNAYSRFEGSVLSNELISGKFTSADLWTVQFPMNSDQSSNFTLIFPDGDRASGVWNKVTGVPVEESVFEYLWMDGIKCTYVVGKNGRLSKATYTDASGEKLKTSTYRKRQKKQTSGDDVYLLPPMTFDNALAALSRQIRLPYFPSEAAKLTKDCPAVKIGAHLLK